VPFSPPSLPGWNTHSPLSRDRSPPFFSLFEGFFFFPFFPCDKKIHLSLCDCIFPSFRPLGDVQALVRDVALPPMSPFRLARKSDLFFLFPFLYLGRGLFPLLRLIDRLERPLPRILFLPGGASFFFSFFFFPSGLFPFLRRSNLRSSSHGVRPASALPSTTLFFFPSCSLEDGP